MKTHEEILDALILAGWGDVDQPKIPRHVMAAAQAGEAIPTRPLHPNVINRSHLTGRPRAIREVPRPSIARRRTAEHTRRSIAKSVESVVGSGASVRGLLERFGVSASTVYRYSKVRGVDGD